MKACKMTRHRQRRRNRWARMMPLVYQLLHQLSLTLTMMVPVGSEAVRQRSIKLYADGAVMVAMVTMVMSAHSMRCAMPWRVQTTKIQHHHQYRQRQRQQHQQCQQCQQPQRIQYRVRLLL